MPTERRLRSKSPARSRSKGRSRSRSRGRSKSPSRRTTKPKQSPSPAPRQSRSRSSTRSLKPVREATTPVRQSARLVEKAAKEEDNDANEKTQSKAGVSQEKDSKRGKKAGFQYVHGGPVGTLLFLFAMPAVVIVLNSACTKKSCSTKMPNVATTLSAYWDPTVVMVFLGWYAFQAVLSVLPIGHVVDGQPLKGGKRLKYRCNGLMNFLISLAAVGGLAYAGYPVEMVYDNFIKFAAVSICFSFVLSTLLYIRSRRLTASKRAEGGNSGCPHYDFFIGAELNPRLKSFDLKVLLHRYYLTTWAVINFILVWQAYKAGTLNSTFVTVVVMQTMLVFDLLFFEDTWHTARCITEDAVGFRKVFTCLAAFPFASTLSARYLLEHPQAWHPAFIFGFVILTVVGYIIFRGSNSEKDWFRKDPHNPMFAKHETIPTPSGKRLLVSGWWGIVRHPNYLGHLILALAWTLPIGTSSAIPYFPLVAALFLLVTRASHDNMSCKKKHGAAWDRYCQRVTHTIIPHVY